MDTWHKIWYEELDGDRNGCVAVRGRATLDQAIGLLDRQQARNEPCWHLVVARTDGSWAFTPLKDLERRLRTGGTEVLDVPLDALDWLIEAQESQIVDLSWIGPDGAKDIAGKVPGNVVIVLDGGQLAGIVYTGTTRGALSSTSTSVLDELPGRHADLEEFEDLLIKKHRPKPQQPPATQER